MKRTRKGFTLLELLVVIGIMGILGATGVVAGQEATNAARATTIADGLEKAATAMMMYYSDHAQVIAAGTFEPTAADIATGVSAYLKAGDALDSTATSVAGKYCVVLGAEETNAAKTWWVSYTFLATDTNFKAMIANKVKCMGLKATAATDGDDYTDSAIVYMQVR